MLTADVSIDSSHDPANDPINESAFSSLNYAKPFDAASGIELPEPEPRWKRYVYGVLAFILSISFFFAVISWWVPTHGGTDQNGYLVGGKMFADTLTMRFSPLHPGSSTEFDPHQFVGKMWVGAGLGTPAERYYPKYPLGLPAIYAAMLWIAALFGSQWSQIFVYGVSPIAMSFAVMGSYLLARKFAGSFGGLLTAIVFATSPVALQLAINPNSHATAVCCVTWGMYFLIGWWQRRGARRAIAAGFLLGYAATIRYSEGTLILPIGLVALFALRWRDWKTLSQAIALFAAWAVPVGLLVLYNHFAIGDLTGYDPTNESTGFHWSYAADNWETMLRSINTTGLAQMFPLALAGLVWMFWWNWRAASVIAAWIVPCLLIYTFYYWAPDGTTIGYLRFFTTILPGLAMCFFWLVSRLTAWAVRHHARPDATGDRRDLAPILIAVIVTTVGLLTMVIVALALEHGWLGEHDPAAAGLSAQNGLVKFLQPAITTAASDTDSARVAALQFYADRFGAIATGAAAALIALALLRGRVVVPAVGAGIFTAMVVAIHLTNAIPALEADQGMRQALAGKIDTIRSAAPDGSVIFCADEPMLDDLQFVGDYELYSGLTFQHDYVQNLPNADPPDQPQGLDPARRDVLYKRLKDLSQPALDDQARRIILDAIAANRRVFFALPIGPNVAIPKKLRRAIGGTGKDKNAHLPDVIARVCTPDRFATDLVAFYPGYLPGVPRPQTNMPRGLKIGLVLPPKVRQGVELIEVTLATPGVAKG